LPSSEYLLQRLLQRGVPVVGVLLEGPCPARPLIVGRCSCLGGAADLLGVRLLALSAAARLSPHLPVDALFEAFTASVTVARMVEAVDLAADFCAAISSATVW
jgi:hypothetical protein